LELDWCKLGSRVKALLGEAQNFGSFGRAVMQNQTKHTYVSPSPNKKDRAITDPAAYNSLSN
jgi:hypothetical protein